MTKTDSAILDEKQKPRQSPPLRPCSICSKIVTTGGAGRMQHRSKSMPGTEPNALHLKEEPFLSDSEIAEIEARWSDFDDHEDDFHRVAESHKALQSRLAQAEQEREDAQRRLTSKTETLEDVMRSFEQVVEQRDTFCTRAIRFCRDKAAEWEQAANAAPVGNFENQRFPYLKMRDAANEIREGLEKLT